jgi:small membrane protein
MTVFEIVVLSFLQFFFGSILLNKIKKKTLSLFDLLFLIALDFVLSLFLIYTDVFNILTALFGIGRGADVIVYFGIITLFYIVFRIYFKMEKMREEITKLNRELSIRDLEKRKNINN